ncbi:hypothetical protein AAFF_G00170330 [Aldrovandia affinis]|uniref:Uncharacterized protein n=1 Tax=Aldrovandia affinis TaxID=143900 RepID=A0AAD7RP67_9TELE|nr:hypothetical protein AAFF_G00170330 [Aldrovandia affinis]
MESPPDKNDSKRKKSPFDVNDSLSCCFQIAQKLKLRLSISDPPGKAEDHSDSDSEIVFGPSLSPTASNELSDTVPLLDQDASQNTTPPQASVHRPQPRDEPRPNPWACSTLVSEAAAPWSNPSCSSHGHERRRCGSRLAPRPGLELFNHFTALLHDEAEFPRLARGSSSASRRSMVKAAAAAARRKSAAIRKRSAGPVNLWRGAGPTDPATDLVIPLAGPATPTADAPSAPLTATASAPSCPPVAKVPFPQAYSHLP